MKIKEQVVTPSEKFVGLATGVMLVITGIGMGIAPLFLGVGHTVSTGGTTFLSLMFGVHNIVACYKPLWY